MRDWPCGGTLLTVEYAGLTPVRDGAVGAWLGPRLGPFGGVIGSVVPRGFEAYARVLHPVTDARGALVSWADVCAATGRRPHALMQWHAIAGVTVTDRLQSMLWDGDEPAVGSLDEPALTALFQVLVAHTESDADCYFALWDGWGPIHGGPAVATVTAVRRPRWLRWLRPKARRGLIPPAFPRSVLEGPRLRLPGRNYLLFTGRLEESSAAGFDINTPNLFWPTDRTWCVATEIDFDSTMIGGPVTLIDDVLNDPTLEAWRVNPGDSLAHDEDTVNT